MYSLPHAMSVFMSLGKGAAIIKNRAKEPTGNDNKKRNEVLL